MRILLLPLLLAGLAAPAAARLTDRPTSGSPLPPPFVVDARPPGPSVHREVRDARAQRSRMQEMDAAAAALRHNLRGALSPALMMADRLIAHGDPAVQRAGEIVVRSIDRATALITATKRDLPPSGP